MEIEASIDMFDKSLKYEKYNMSVRARAIYWRGEAYYRLGPVSIRQGMIMSFSWECQVQCSLSESKLVRL